jgi:hypothetical protein
VESPGAIAVAGPRRLQEQERKSDEEKCLEDVEMQGTTEVPALVVQSNLLEALAIDEYPGKISSEADVVVAEPVSEEKGAKGRGIETHMGRGDSSSLDCRGHCCGYCGFYNGVFEKRYSSRQWIKSGWTRRTSFAMRHRSF